MDCIGSSNLRPTLGSDPESLDTWSPCKVKGLPATEHEWCGTADGLTPA